MPDPSDLGALSLAVGEMRGQLREVVHSQNNIAQKVDFLTERALLAPTTAQLEALGKRVDALEAAKDRDDGAKGVLAAVMKSPTAAWIAGIIGVLYGTIKGGFLK